MQANPIPNQNALVLVLHGYGSDAADMQPLVSRLAAALLHAKVVAIQGPQRLPDGGRGWFDIAGVSENGRGPRVRAAMPELERQIVGELEKAGLDHSSLVLFGFSQGATTALQYAISSPRSPRAIVAIAGRLTGDIDAAAKERAMIMLGHGEEDAIIPVSEMAEAERRLCAAGFDVETRTEAGLGHTISDRQINDAIGFLSRFLSRTNDQHNENEIRDFGP